MNWKPLSLIAVVALAAGAVLVRTPVKGGLDQHREARQLVLYYTLGRFNDPVIVVGDSIVEASTLPRSICGHAVINAGLNGASSSSDLGGWLGAALDGKRAAAIIVSLGVNDALTSTPQRTENFAASYSALLALLSKSTSRLAVMQVAAVEAQKRMSPEMRDAVMRTVDAYNTVLREVAVRNGASFVALPGMPTPHTMDGVHLNADGYLAWEKAVMETAGGVCD